MRWKREHGSEVRSRDPLGIVSGANGAHLPRQLAPRVGGASRTRPAAVAAALVLGAALLGCGGPEVRAPNPTRTLDERRAIEVIGSAIAQENVRPAAGRNVELVSGKPIRIDVGVQDHDFGVAYITDKDAEALGVAIPQANKQDEKLHIVRAGADGEIRIVLLYENNYRYDDLVGEAHEQTTIAAERLLTRDVQDFITYAKTQKFK